MKFFIAVVFLFFSLSAHSQALLNRAIKKATSSTDNNSSSSENNKNEKSEGFTSATHQKYAGQIVFANDEISKENPDESKFKKLFTLGETIYGRVYLEKPLVSYPLYEGNEKSTNLEGGTFSDYFSLAYIDGKPLYDPIKSIYSGRDRINNDDTHVTTLYFHIFQKDVERHGNPTSLYTALNKLSDGEHTFRLDVYGGKYGKKQTKTPIASNEITVVKKGKVLFYNDFNKLEPGLEDAALETNFSKTLQDHGKKEGWKETFSSVKIKSDGWAIVRHPDSGVILGRLMAGWAYAVWPDGHCTYQEFNFKQDYDGSKYMENSYIAGVGGQRECNCR